MTEQRLGTSPAGRQQVTDTLKGGGGGKRGVRCLYLLEAGDGVHELDVQFCVVLSQRLVSVVTDELHHRAERERV